MALDKAQVLQALTAVKDPDLHKDIVKLGFVKDVSIDGGPAAYQRLFWEAGAVGQALYLEAEAAGMRGTGIGCFFDDGVHELLGIADHSLQSLYHFTVGGPVDDPRLATQPGYPWELR